MKTIPDHFVFMKIGTHAAESLEDILERKRKEFDNTGRIFWGYGGATCHPTKQVQPFVRSRLIAGVHDVFLLMESVKSLANPRIAPAREYSEDNVVWKPIPKGINVTGSSYALVLDEIKPMALDFDPREFAVAVGNSAGKSASDYLRGRVDKGCFGPASKPALAPGIRHHQIGLVARLQTPYAVFVRP